MNFKNLPLYPPEAYNPQNNLHAFSADGGQMNAKNSCVQGCNLDYGPQQNFSGTNQNAPIGGQMGGGSMNAIMPLLLKMMGGGGAQDALSALTGSSGDNPLMGLISSITNQNKKKPAAVEQRGEKPFPQD